MSVRKYIIRKIVVSVLVLLGVSLLTFIMGRLAPGDPVDTVLGGISSPTEEEIAAARKYLGLDEPLPVQYLKWLSHVLKGDLGVSYQSGRPVSRELAVRLPQTMLLTLGSAVVMLAVAFPLGIASALRYNGPLDYIIRFINVLVISIPSFCLGILLLLFLGVRHRLLPTIGSGSVRHLVMPSLAIGLGSGAGLSRLIRSQILKHMEAEHVVAARVFGVKASTLLRNHVLKNAIPPVITNIGLTIGAMLGGSAIIETLFSWPGAGSYAVSAIYARDYPVIQAYALIMACIYILINALIEISYCITMPSLFMPGGSDEN